MFSIPHHWDNIFLKKHLPCIIDSCGSRFIKLISDRTVIYHNLTQFHQYLEFEETSLINMTTDFHLVMVNK